MKLVSSYILDIVIILIVSILVILNVIQNYEYNQFLQKHYDIVSKIKESAFSRDSIMESQSENTTIKKESDSVYEITSTFTYSIPLITFNDYREVQNYVFVQEVQQ